VDGSTRIKQDESGKTRRKRKKPEKKKDLLTERWKANKKGKEKKENK
jgi:hypothetical protein